MPIKQRGSGYLQDQTRAVVHEFRNSLATITSCTMTLLDDADAFPRVPSSDLVAVLRRQIARVEWLLAAFEPDDGRDREPTDVDVLRLTVEACAFINVPLTWGLGDAHGERPITVHADERRLAAALETLILALSSGPSVSARITRDAFIVRSTMRDTSHASVRWKLDRARALLSGEGLRLRVRTGATGTVAKVVLVSADV
jgi:hypothetical protein